VREVVAVNRGFRQECSIVGRVRKLLADFEGAMQRPRDVVATARLTRARELGRADLDLEEIQDRLLRLKIDYPELNGVEVGPLVLPAHEYLARKTSRFNGGDTSAAPVEDSRGVAG
jgi:hypothetical protein